MKGLIAASTLTKLNLGQFYQYFSGLALMKLVVGICCFAVLQGLVSAVVTWTETDKTIVVQNGYTYLSFNKAQAAIDKISADFSGQGNFDKNNLAEPYALKVSKHGIFRSTECPVHENKAEWVQSSGHHASFRVSVRDTCEASTSVVSEEWTISLRDDERAVTVSINGQVIQDASVDYILHGVYTPSSSLYGLFNQGVVQMKDNVDACMGAPQTLRRAYVLGNGMAMDIIRHEYDSADIFDDDSTATGSPSTTVLKSAHSTFASGIEDVLFGTFPSTSTDMSVAWSKACWKNTKPTSVLNGTTYAFGITFVPNNYDFPVYLLNNLTTTQATVLFEQLRAYLTGIYASPVGCLQSYYAKQTGTIAPTISHPDVGYAPDTNFFDPDNFISLSAMLYSGDNYLIRQVKEVLQRTAQTMCGLGTDQVELYCNTTLASQKQPGEQKGLSKGAENVPVRGRKHPLYSTKRFNHAAVGNDEQVNTRTGQLMHHYVSLVPTYESIAGSEQLGPNIFWTFSVLRYVALTQDRPFAEAMFPFVDLSTRYVLTFFDEQKGLFNAPGPLWIDVIIRENYASDSNGMLVLFLQKVADFYDYMQVDAEFATSLRTLSGTVSQGIRELLFNTTSNDHFITQLNPDGTTRDFVDYDSNLMTVAFGIITDPAQIQRVLTRVDSGPYTHVRGTWCSEVPYSGDAQDCYIVGGSVCGDSVVTLARIGWVDALARKRVGDLKTFEELLLKPLQQDLLNDVWLYERYDANGTQIRTPFYFEYPSLVVMMLREVQYGIDIDLLNVNIDPFPAKPYQLTLGVVSVGYSDTQVVLNLPGVSAQASEKLVSIGGLRSTASYTVSNTCSDQRSAYTTDASGKLSFRQMFVTDCVVTATLDKC